LQTGRNNDKVVDFYLIREFFLVSLNQTPLYYLANATFDYRKFILNFLRSTCLASQGIAETNTVAQFQMIRYPKSIRNLLYYLFKMHLL